MEILGIGAKNDGCSYHRVFLPVAYMDKTRGKITNNLNEDVFDGWDILLINRLIYNFSIEQLKSLKHKFGFKFVVDMDDHWILNHGHILKDLYDSDLTPKVIDCMKFADLVTCTHERLAADISHINPNVEVLPNALPYGDGQFSVKCEASDKMRIIWCGGLTHQQDMRLLKNPMKRVATDSSLSKKVHMVFGGYTDQKDAKPIADDMLHSFTCGLKIPGEIRGARHVFEYMEIYEDTDVSVVPLLPSKFNSSKSNLKVLEAAACGNACIVSRVDPYLGFPEDTVLYVDNQADWYRHIKYLADNPNARIDRAAKLQEYCHEHYNLFTVSKKRRQILDQLL
jgi:glycosyltransferase involved in cell wall biosynthesis